MQLVNLKHNNLEAYHKEYFDKDDDMTSRTEREKLIQEHSERSSMLTVRTKDSPKYSPNMPREGYENAEKSGFTSGFETLQLTAN